MRERLESRSVWGKAGWACWAGGGVEGVAGCLLINSYNFFETASVVHCESTSALKKRKPWNINILISCAWQRA